MIFAAMPGWESVAASSVAMLAALAVLTRGARLHGRRLARVPVRIHVAGTRGKTSVARLVGAGLAQGGRRVLVRTTGTEPQLIYPDGVEERWPRLGPTSISEIGRLVRIAAEVEADTLVLESMAIEPEYLWASERYLVRATHLVVTNLRPDHEEVFRLPDEDMETAAGTLVPRGGQVFLTPESDCPALRTACAASGCTATMVTNPEGEPLEINRQLALAVCRDLGVAEAVALAGMETARPDSGAFAVFTVGQPQAAWRLVSAFACNDPVSLERLWRAHPHGPDPVVLLNARADRPLRTQAFLALLARLEPSVRLVLLGPVPLRWTRQAGFAAAQVSRLRSQSPQGALEELGGLVAPGGTVWGVGNYAGLGAEIVALVGRKAIPC